ncbi:MAG: hypothetical protein QOG61_1719 [Candidatus Binataceae bacterium]|nr:hypothetical protein [Candidatus Binataceae bacterium]MEA2678657.1 hypothetical protein [Candidatus Binataceae bacterium]
MIPEQFPILSSSAAQSEAESQSAIDRNEPPLDRVREINPVQDDNEVVRLLREMHHDLAKLTKISEKASRRSKTHLDFLEGTKFSRRFGISLLIVIAVLMLIQILQMAGYGPGGGADNSDSTQTLQRIHTAG